jgi:hypothetical protein
MLKVASRIVAVGIVLLLAVFVAPAAAADPSSGHSPGYFTLRGTLDFDGKIWLLRYGDRDEFFGGSARITNPKKLSGFHSGDAVVAHGIFYAGPTAAQLGLLAGGWIFVAMSDSPPNFLLQPFTILSISRR